MINNMKKLSFWLPRILTIAFILFMSMFALDVFGEGYVWYELLLALFMHLIPSFILIAMLVFAWKRPIVGAVGYLALVVIMFFFFRLYNDFIAALIIIGPVIVISILFFWSYKRK